MPRQQRVTIREIARMCDVSMQTVSRVINNRPDVAPATRQAVEAAIASVGFRPSAVARSLVQRRSQTLGVIVTGLKYFGVAETLNGITEASQTSDFALLIKELASDDVEGFVPAIDFLIGHRVEGLIIFAPSDVGSLSAVQAEVPVNRPPIALLKSEPSTEFSTISIDDRGGARLATEHLIALGRRRIGHIGGPQTWHDARERTDGWRSALADAGIDPGPVAYGDWSSASGEAAGLELLATGQELDAVFVANDQMALGLLHVANAHGIAVPDALAVVGFDGLLEGAQFTPSLTTIVQPLRELGRMAVMEVVARIDAEVDAGGVRNVTLATELLIRDSAPAVGVRAPS
jgi:DNA-binding LacI/PurR family transcriptional regulator